MELRPVVLRSFHSIACRAQLEQISTLSSLYATPSQGVITSPAFLERYGRENGKLLEEGTERQIDEGDHIQKPDEHDVVGLEGSDEHGGMVNANALEVNEKEDEEPGLKIFQRNGISKRRKTISEKPVHVSRVVLHHSFKSVLMLVQVLAHFPSRDAATN